MNMQCPECRHLVGAEFRRCPQCGSKIAHQQPQKKDKNKVALVYAGILIGWALLFPFLTPIIVHYSLDYQARHPGVTITLPHEVHH